MKLIKVVGSTSQLCDILIQDSTSTTGAGKTGLVYNTAGLTAYYHRSNANASTSITLATMTLGTFASGGFKEVDATNMPGVYQFCPPDAALASGATSVSIVLRGATGMVDVRIEIQLTAANLDDGVRAGLTALPNAAAEAAGGLYTRGTGAGQINQPANGMIDGNVVRWLGTAAATPATAGIPDVNVKNMNNVAATSITTINANQGTTQPVNFTGTGASALAKSDMVDIAGAAVSTSSAQIGVNAVNIGGTAQTGRDIGASVLISSGTGAGQLDVTSGVIKANLAQILGTALTETAGQIAAAFKQFFDVASPTGTMKAITAVTTVTTTTNLTNAPTAGDFTATMKTSLNAATPASVTGAVGSVTGNVGGNVVGSVASVTGAVGSVTAGVTVTTNNDKTGYSLATTPLASADYIAASGTASAGAATTITLAGASATDDLYKNATVAVIGGTGAGQVRTITGYVGSTKVATVSPAWATNPDNTSLFRVYYAGPGVVDVNNDKTGYTASTVTDKTGYALTAGEHTAIASDAQTGLTAQGYTTTRAGYLDTLNGLVQAIWDKATSALTTAGSIGKLLVDNINATISSRLASASYTAPLSSAQTASAVLDATAASYNTASTIGEKINGASAPSAATVADAVWDEAISGHLSAGSTGASLNAAGSAGDPWVTTLPGAYGAGSAGYIIGTNVDATVSSRLATAGYTAPPAASAIRTEMDSNSTKLANLDAAVSTRSTLTAAGVWDALLTGITTVGSVGKLIKDYLDAAISSRMATFSYTTPPTVTAIRQEMDANSTKLDVAVSSRLATAGYTAPLNTAQTAAAVLDAVAADYNDAGSIGAAVNSASAPSAATVADAVWDEAISGHLTAGTTGAKLNSAAAAGDPWSTALPGSYASGEAGNILSAIKTKTDVISSSSITVTSPVVDASTVQIVRGDDYKNTDGRALFATTTFSNVPTLTGGTVTLKVQKSGGTTFTKAGVVVGAAACYVELTTAETAALPTGKYKFDLEAALSNSDIVTIAQGTFEVLKDVR